MKGNVTPHYYLGLSWWLMVKNLLAMWETQVWSLGWKDPLEKGKASHSRVLAWRIPQTEEPGGLSSMGSQRIRHKWATNTFTWLPWVAQVVKNLPAMQGIHPCSILGQEDPLERGMATHCSILAWRCHGQRSLVDYCPLGCKELYTTEWLSMLGLS